MNFKFDAKDLVIFTKIVCSGLLIVGFILLGYYGGLHFENKYDLPQSTPVWGALIGAVLGPVSYTHLDVYKRQTYNRLCHGASIVAP